MQNLRMCYKLANTNTSHLDRAPPDALVVYTQKKSSPEIKKSIQATTQVTYSLINFELKPAGMKVL